MGMRLSAELDLARHPGVMLRPPRPPAGPPTSLSGSRPHRVWASLKAAGTRDIWFWAQFNVGRAGGCGQRLGLHGIADSGVGDLG